MVGRPFEVCVVIRNTGDGPAENATATVRLPVGFQFEDNTNEKVWQGGTVPAGGSIRQCWRVTATSATRGSIDVTVQGAGGLSTSCGSAVEVTMPDLAITKSAPKRAHMGREFEYSIEVKNTGSSDATNVQLVDQLPEGVEFKSASENGSYNGGSRSISWNLGTLRPSESRNFNIVVKAMRENLIQAGATLPGSPAPRALPVRQRPTRSSKPYRPCTSTLMIRKTRFRSAIPRRM
jgi:uncharacterized repeat protein (TIGR01451 family)